MRKAFKLARAGAEVTIVSPVVTDALKAQVDAGRIRWIEGSFAREHLDGAFLVVAATDDEVLNERIVQIASEAGALMCDASSAERSQVIFGALHDSEEEATIAVFTGGRDPSLSRRMRDRIAKLLAEDDARQTRS